MTHLLITGRPGCGKTTLIRKVVDTSFGLSMKGFYTEEIRERGVRVGFRVVSLPERESFLLSHVKFENLPKVGKYGVDVVNFENFIKRHFHYFTFYKLLVIDEIGPMELKSPLFEKLVMEVLNQESTRLLGTIQFKLKLQLKTWVRNDKVYELIDLEKIGFEKTFKIIKSWLEGLWEKS